MVGDRADHFASNCARHRRDYRVSELAIGLGVGDDNLVAVGIKAHQLRSLTVRQPARVLVLLRNQDLRTILVVRALIVRLTPSRSARP